MAVIDYSSPEQVISELYTAYKVSLVMESQFTVG